MIAHADDTPTAPRRLWQLQSWLLAQAAIHGQRATGRRFAVLGVRRQHFHLLTALADHSPASQADLGRQLAIDRSDMVALVSELERAGFVRRSPDPSDGRRKLVGLTPAGVFALRQLDAHVSEAEDDLLRPLSPPERDQLERLLTRLVEHHSRTTQP